MEINMYIFTPLSHRYFICLQQQHEVGVELMKKSKVLIYFRLKLIYRYWVSISDTLDLYSHKT